MKKYLVFCIFFLAFTCEETIRFDQPQPANKKDLEEIPDHLYGKYMELGDSSYLFIDKNKIIEKNFYEISAGIEEVTGNEDCYIENDTLFCTDPLVSIPLITIKNDSIFAIYPVSDTLFILTQKQKLRKLGKYYFLNYYIDDVYWRVKLLKRISKDGLVISDIHKKDSAQIMKYTDMMIVKNEQDTIINYRIDPTVKELKNIIKAGLFREKKIYKKVE